MLPFADMSAGKDRILRGWLVGGVAQPTGEAARAASDRAHLVVPVQGRNEDLRAIGEKLNVAHVLEGSVRRSGEKVRITAQLIRAADGSHLWSESYDRTLDDIFVVQDDIAGGWSMR